MRIDIKGLDKAELLAGLYNASKPLGLGFLHATTEPMSRQDAEAIIAEQGLYFDYLNGRVMKVNLEGDELQPSNYDRNNGEGSAANVVNAIKTGGPVPSQTKEFGEGFDAFLRAAVPTTCAGNNINLGVDEELREALLQARRRLNLPKTGKDGMS